MNARCDDTSPKLEDDESEQSSDPLELDAEFDGVAFRRLGFLGSDGSEGSGNGGCRPVAKAS